MAQNPMISVVVPMYNEEEVIDVFFEAITPVLRSLTDNYEIICVNDGSSDMTLPKLIAARNNDPAIKIVDLSRNFGKELALTAGLDFATGDAVVPIDADLQDPPELITEMVQKWRDGADMVIAVRSDRDNDGWFKRKSAELFYRVAGRLSDTGIPDNAGDFRLMDRKVIEALRAMPERTRFMKGIFAWLGFKQAEVTYARPKRAAGTTKWKFWKLWNFALEGIFSFTTLPLRIWTYIGFAVSVIAPAYGSFIVVRTLIFGNDVPGYASTITLILFFSGLNMLGLGILGEYVGRVFMEVKRRPLYLVREAIGLELEKEER
ncbi:glycosyltransferase family 2 protein [Hyphococcus sp. DH-69]|uniref:glycosyltransferase family 2 protein n=1 Tax=Hyphococcus formosus TaxID=3143534 RepID=UPI00398B8F25